MTPSRFCLVVDALTTSIMFGLWQSSVPAAGFMFLLIGTCLSAIEYAKQPSSQDTAQEKP